jgi:hypothetical protein
LTSPTETAPPLAEATAPPPLPAEATSVKPSPPLPRRWSRRCCCRPRHRRCRYRRWRRYRASWCW